MPSNAYSNRLECFAVMLMTQRLPSCSRVCYHLHSSCCWHELCLVALGQKCYPNEKEDKFPFNKVLSTGPQLEPEMLCKSVLQAIKPILSITHCNRYNRAKKNLTSYWSTAMFTEEEKRQNKILNGREKKLNTRKTCTIHTETSTYRTCLNSGQATQILQTPVTIKVLLFSFRCLR